MRAAWCAAVLVLAVGCGKRHEAPTAVATRVEDVLKAYSENPASADGQYKSREVNMYVPGLRMKREAPDAFQQAGISPESTIGLFSDWKLHAVFYFDSEAEAAKVKPRTQYQVAGRCEGLDGKNVVFRGCRVTEWTPPSKP